jgi:hypothetical protein
MLGVCIGRIHQCGGIEMAVMVTDEFRNCVAHGVFD